MRTGWRWFLLVLLAAAPALACQLFSGTVATPAPSPTAFAVETAVPAAPASPEVEEEAASTALATFENEEVGLTFQYPSDWALDASDDIPMIASDPRLLGDDDSEVSGAVVLFLVDDATRIGDGPLDQVLEDVVAELIAGGEITDGPALATINGQEAATITLESEEPNGAHVYSHVTVIREEGRMVLISAAVPLANVGTYEPVLETIVSSVTLSPPVGPARAGSITYGETVRGEVAGLRGVAWTLKGAAGDALDIEVIPANEELDVTVDVRNSEGESILPDGEVDEAFGTETISNLVLPQDGEYAIVLHGFAGSTGDYTLAVTTHSGVAAADDGAVVPGQSYRGQLEADGVDTYLLPDLGGANLTLEIVPAAELDAVVEVYSPDGSLSASADDGFSGGTERLTVAATGGTVQIRGFAGDSGEYALNVSDSSAAPQGTRIVVRDELGAADGSGHVFPFTAPEGATVSAEIVPESGLDVLIEVWNDDTEELLETIDLSFGDENASYTTSRAGNYSFIVRGYEGQTGAYTLTMSGPASVLFELAIGDEVSGALDDQAVTEFLVALDPGESVVLTAYPDAETDAVLEVSDLDGNLLASADEYFPGGEETLTFAAPEDVAAGTLFVIAVRDYNGGAGGQFTLEMR